METFINDTIYIHSDSILNGIYERATNKFMKDAGKRIVFFDLADYIKQQLVWKKQDVYYHGLPLLKEVCRKIGENFELSIEYSAPNAKCYRDVFFEIFN